MDKKTCVKCKNEKPISDFRRDKFYKGGWQHSCKQCISLYSKNIQAARATSKRFRERHKERLNADSKKYMASPRGRFIAYKCDAERRNYFFDLSEEFFSLLLEKDCFYCGKVRSYGVDRVINSIGYVESNVVPCCKVCNRMKNNLDGDEFIDHVRKIAKVTAG